MLTKIIYQQNGHGGIIHRVTIPKEMIIKLGIEKDDSINLEMIENYIKLSKSQEDK